MKKDEIFEKNFEMGPCVPILAKSIIDHFACLAMFEN